jgi:hypothetical protein
LLVLTPDFANWRSVIATLKLLQYNAVFHHRDIVEEIATQRQGEIDAIDQYIVEGQKAAPCRWRVRFLDESEPRSQYFVKPEDLRLIRCPHTGQ